MMRQFVSATAPGVSRRPSRSWVPVISHTAIDPSHLMLPDQVGPAVPIDVCGGADLPIQIGNLRWRQRTARQENGLAHQPHGETAIRLVLEDRVSSAVPVEVSGSNQLPGRVGKRARPERPAIDQRGVVHEPDSEPTVGVLPQDVAAGIDVEVAVNGCRVALRNIDRQTRYVDRTVSAHTTRRQDAEHDRSRAGARGSRQREDPWRIDRQRPAAPGLSVDADRTRTAGVPESVLTPGDRELAQPVDDALIRRAVSDEVELTVLVDAEAADRRRADAAVCSMMLEMAPVAPFTPADQTRREAKSPKK